MKTFIAVFLVMSILFGVIPIVVGFFVELWGSQSWVYENSRRDSPIDKGLEHLFFDGYMITYGFYMFLCMCSLITTFIKREHA